MNTQLTSWIDEHERELIEFLKEYISYRSPPGEEQEVQLEFIKPFFEDEMEWDDITVVDVSAEGDRPNINARLAGDGEGEGMTLLFNGHSDIVDVPEEVAQTEWQTDPWRASLDEGNLYGRGANDMKGPNAAMIWAAKAVMETDIELSGDLLMSIVVGEEAGEGRDIGSAPATQAFLDQDHDIPFCVNTEPTDLEIHLKSSTLFDFDIRIQGKRIHTSQKNLTQYPQRRGLPTGQDVGVDAIPLMNEIIDRLLTLEHQWNLRYRDTVWGSGGYPSPLDKQGVGTTSMNLHVESDGEMGSIAGVVDIKGTVYAPPFADAAELWQEMQEAVRSLEATNDWLAEHPPEMEWKSRFDFPAFSVPLDHPGTEALGQAVEAVTGEEPIYSGSKHVADNSFIQNDCGVPTVSIGPGNISMGTHGADEYVPLEQLVNAAKIYATMIAGWCQ